MNVPAIEMTDTATDMPIQLSAGISDEERCDTIREDLKRISKGADRFRALLADRLSEVKEQRYWQRWGYRSFRAYVETECSLSLRSAQALISTLGRFQALGVTTEGLRTLEWSKAEVAARVVEKENLEELLNDMAKLPFRELTAKVQSLQAAKARTEEPVETTVSLVRTSTASERKTGGGVDGWRFPKPAGDEFFVDDEQWDQVCFAASRGMNVLITGPSGCGKTQTCRLVADAAGRPVASFNFGAMSEPRSSLIGNTHFDRRKGTWFRESRFVSAIRQEGTMILLDEINRAGRDAFNVLFTLLDQQGYMALDESEGAEVVRRAAGVSFFATANLGMEYTGAEPLDKALADRFPSVIAMNFPPKEAEVTLLVQRNPGLDKAAAKRLVALASRQREMASEGEFVGQVSTRSLLAVGAQIAAGMPIESAVKFCILNRFSAEGGDVSERVKLMQIFQRLK